MSTHLGFGIGRSASNQMLCEVCGQYVPWSYWAKKFGECRCSDLELRWQLLSAWKRIERGPWNNPKRPYDPDYSRYLRTETEVAQTRFSDAVKVRYVSLKEKAGRAPSLDAVLEYVCNEWKSRKGRTHAPDRPPVV